MAIKTKPITKAKKTASKSNKVLASKKKFTLSPKQRIAVLVAAVIALAGAGYGVYAAYQNTTPNAWSCVDRTYRSGSSSVCVTYLLTIANTKTTTDLKPGPHFGTKTKTAVENFQKAVRFSKRNQDGVVGPQTWKALCKVAADKQLEMYRKTGCKKIDDPSRYNKRKGTCKALGFKWKSRLEYVTTDPNDKAYWCARN